jgi:Mn-dependent DtxR family transcriptional regulator
MNSTPLTLGSLLIALFDLARLGLPADVGRVAGRLGVERARVASGLTLLDQNGLVDADRAQLTLAGLALAARLDADRQARHDAGSADGRAPSADSAVHLAA